VEGSRGEVVRWQDVETIEDLLPDRPPGPRAGRDHRLHHLEALRIRGPSPRHHAARRLHPPRGRAGARIPHRDRHHHDHRRPGEQFPRTLAGSRLRGARPQGAVPSQPLHDAERGGRGDPRRSEERVSARGPRPVSLARRLLHRPRDHVAAPFATGCSRDSAGGCLYPDDPQPNDGAARLLPARAADPDRASRGAGDQDCRLGGCRGSRGPGSFRPAGRNQKGTG